MPSGWISNTGAKDQVVSLLKHAGIPLELQVDEICQQFCSASPSSEILASCGRVVYSSTETADEYREVDQCLTFQSMISWGEVHLTLTVSYPIECKHRKDVEFFAFPTSDSLLHQRFPISIEGLKYLTPFNQLTSSLADTLNTTRANLTGLRIEAGQTPKNIHEENTIYNAAGALYDFISVDLAEEHPLKIALKQKADKVLDEMGLRTRAENEKLWYSINYGEASAPQKWLSKTATLRRCRSFNRRLLDSLTLLDSARFALEEIRAYIPIVCINGPIYEVAWNTVLGTGNFSEIPFCMTSFRKRGWPGKARRKLIHGRPEVPVIITNPEHLQDVLKIGYVWLQEACKTARELVVARKEHLPLETHLGRQIADMFVQDTGSAIYKAEAGT